MLKDKTPEKVDNNPIGTGPFELVNYVKDSRIIYKSFDGYWGEKPKIDRLVFSITPDASIRYAKLLKNECQAMPYPNPADLKKMSQDPNINLLHQQGLNTGFLAYNVQKSPLNDTKIRQALTLAINKNAIIDAVFQGAGTAAKNLIPPSMWGANDSIKDYPYDPAQAKKLLQQAGYPNGFKIDLWAMPVQRPYNPNARRMAEMIQSDWEKIGVHATIVSYEWGEYLNRARNGEHQAMLMGWTSDNGDPGQLLSTLYSCKSASDGSNYSRWCDKSFDTVLEKARGEQDAEKRKALIYQAQIIMHDQIPAVMIAHSIVYEPVRKEVLGYIIDPLAKHHFDNVSLK
jgi:dipeptide transport system substrate-binding protein